MADSQTDERIRPSERVDVYRRAWAPLALPFDGSPPVRLLRWPNEPRRNFRPPEIPLRRFKKARDVDNKLTVREEVSRSRIFADLRALLISPDAIEHARRNFAEELGKWSRHADTAVEEQRARLARTEERIGNLITFISNGDHSERVRLALEIWRHKRKWNEPLLPTPSKLTGPVPPSQQRGGRGTRVRYGASHRPGRPLGP